MGFQSRWALIVVFATKCIRIETLCNTANEPILTQKQNTTLTPHTNPCSPHTNPCSPHPPQQLAWGWWLIWWVNQHRSSDQLPPMLLHLSVLLLYSLCPYCKTHWQKVAELGTIMLEKSGHIGRRRQIMASEPARGLSGRRQRFGGQTQPGVEFLRRIDLCHPDTHGWAQIMQLAWGGTDRG